jgi:sporadic carbohydrate cluster protein (TIGR04323 family)
MADAANAPAGYRGYIASRPVNGVPYPHKVQNLIIRDYCKRKDMAFLLSVTEVATPGSFLMLNDLLSHLTPVSGIVLFSLFMLPAEKNKRDDVIARIIGAGKEVHAALEEIVIRNIADIAIVEDTITVSRALPYTPFHGAYDKDGAVLDRSAFTGT